MPRRKQDRPKHLGSPQELAISLQNGIASGSSSETESDEHVCGKCRAEFPTLADFLSHKKLCALKTPVLLGPPTTLEGGGDTTDDDETMMTDADYELPHPPRSLHPQLSRWLMSNLASTGGTNVTLAELENTCVAVSQSAQLGDILYTFHKNQAQSFELLQAITKMLREAGGLAAPPLGAFQQEGPPPPAETNALALLEKQAEKCIQDSMARKSFLNGMDDERSKKKGDGGERHKCQYCGKLLGSDSALQIHLRSHTGEKPFQCSVCGSAFSTRGNLKVHCQRHVDEARENHQPPPLFGPDGDIRADISKGDQALDFSKSLNGQKSSPRAESRSRSVSPNGTSNFSDNSNDASSDDNLNEEYSHLKLDVDQFEEEERDSNCMDEDESDCAPARIRSFSTSPNFTPFFFQPPYDNILSTGVAPNGNNSSNNNNNNNIGENGTSAAEGSDSILQDPSYYQDLLPRIGSNDNSWESLIEVTKPSETSKLQQLVDNIENKLTDPNQCIICHRVLSCKSALQMHYRTHTGERPYKCKLCNRAFTTKGNLKTHMGVHRTKPQSRLMHQCPVCHRQFPNSVILQQHVQSHTSEQVMQIPPPLYNPMDDRPPTLLPPSYPRQFLVQPPPLVNVEPLALTRNRKDESRSSLPLPVSSESVIKPTGVDSRTENSRSPALSGSCSPSSNLDDSQLDRSGVLNFSRTESLKDEPDSVDGNQKPSGVGSSNGFDKDRTPDDRMQVDDEKSDGKSTPKPDRSRSRNQSPKSEADGRNLMEMPENMSSKYSSHPNSIMVPSSVGNRQLPMSLPSDCPLPFGMPVSAYPPLSLPSCSTNYTASLTALENHVKSITSTVTHPLPFPPHYGLGMNLSGYFRDSYGSFNNNNNGKSAASPKNHNNGSDVSADDRSTPGVKGESPRSSGGKDAGALDLTPRGSPGFQRPTDMKMFPPPMVGLPFVTGTTHRISTTCRVCYKTFACNSALEIHYRSHTKERPFRCEVCDRGFSTKGNMRQHMLTHKIRDFPSPAAFSGASNSSASSKGAEPAAVEEKTPPPKKEEKRSDPPPVQTPKRAPGQPKHMCQVCHKPFSSGSALQIHMRTHTGDKPFQCNICHRAFTTKGNLKVHMGTHMWNNSTSRRGRRMSLDITPLQLAPGGKPGEFVQATPPFYSYPALFLNGLAPPPPQHHAPPPPKMNEISVIQTAGQQPLALLAKDESSSAKRPASPPQGKDEMVGSWPWKISCNSCNKICGSSTELELHVRNNHCANKEPPSSETERTD